MTDERQGLPSASSFGMDVACAGRQNLLHSLTPEQLSAVDDTDDVASRGVRIHAALCTGDTTSLSEDELEDYNKCKEIADTILHRWNVDLDGPIKIEKETRLWLHDEEFNPTLSGQPDLVYISGFKALVLDYKTFFNKTLTPSQRNWQLRVLALLVAKTHGVMEVQVGFVKPKSKLEPADITNYTTEDLQQSDLAISEVLQRIKEPNAKRTAGPHCLRCPAAGRFCPESIDFSIQTVTAYSDPLEAVKYLSVQDRAVLEEKKAVITEILKRNSALLKKESDEVLASVGFRRTEGRRTEPVVDSRGAFGALLTAFPGLPQDALWKSMELRKTALTLNIHSCLEGGTKKKDVEILVKQTLQPFTEERRSEGSLEKI